MAAGAGLTALMAASKTAYLMLRIASTIFLGYLGVRSWIAVFRSLHEAELEIADESKRRAFAFGEGLLAVLAHPPDDPENPQRHASFANTVRSNCGGVDWLRGPSRASHEAKTRLTNEALEHDANLMRPTTATLWRPCRIGGGAVGNRA